MNKSVSQYSEHPWSDVTSKLHLAKKKLAPVIKNLMDSASGDSDHPARPCMTVDEYSDAVWAAGILAEVEETLEKSKRKKHMKLPQNLNTKFDFPTKDLKVNELGKVYIDTSVLVQLIELHQSLGAIIKNINELSYDNNNSCKKEKNNNIVLKVLDDHPDERQSLNMEDNRICNKLGKQIVVMTANVVTDNEEADTRKTKSTGSLYDRSPKVDSAGARKIIINCIADLDKVKEFLESDTERSRPESQKSSRPESQKSDTSKFSQRGESSEEPQTAAESGEGSSSAQEILLEESDLNSSKIVICIKGQNEEDLQIVIRQCPECKQNNIEPAPQPPAQPLPPTRVMPPSEPTKPPAKQPSIRFSNMNVPPEGGEEQNREVEILHGQDRAGTESDSTEKSKLSMLFNVQDPSKSIVDCVPINMYDAHRVCFTTENGEEMLLTLTIAPKNTAPPSPPPAKNRSTQMRQPSDQATAMSAEAAGDQPISVQDIFSDASVRAGPSTNQLPANETGVSNDDLLIPLYRTKVCSSLQLDVERAPSRMRNEGIIHDDKSISLHLNKMGVDKLLRACRPVKCARKAILNESSKKCLPYAPSLKSLPLDEADLEIVNQSLEMSVTRSRTSTVYIKKPTPPRPDRYNVRFQVNQALTLSNVSTGKKKSSSIMYIKRPSGDDSMTSQYKARQVYYFHVHVPREAKDYLIKKKLEYYIYLNSDSEHTKDSLVKIFDVHIRKKAKVDKATNSDIIGLVYHDKVEKKRLSLLPAVSEDQYVFTMNDKKVECFKRKRKILPSRIPIYKYRRKKRDDGRQQSCKKNVPADAFSVACHVDVLPVNMLVQKSLRKAEGKSVDSYKFNKKSRRQPIVQCTPSKSLSHLKPNVKKLDRLAVRSIEPNNVAEAPGPGLSEKSESKIIVHGISSMFYNAFIKKLSGSAKAEMLKVVNSNCSK